MIDITGYLAVHFTVMMKFFSFFFFLFFFLQLNSHIQTPHPLGISQKKEKLKIQHNASRYQYWKAMVERTVYDYSEQHPPFVHFFFSE